MSVKDKVSSHFVDDWKNAYTWASVQFAVVAGLVVTWMTTYPDQYEAVISHVPEQYRPLVGAAAAMLPIYLRMKK